MSQARHAAVHPQPMALGGVVWTTPWGDHGAAADHGAPSSQGRNWAFSGGSRPLGVGRKEPRTVASERRCRGYLCGSEALSEPL